MRKNKTNPKTSSVKLSKADIEALTKEMKRLNDAARKEEKAKTECPYVEECDRFGGAPCPSCEWEDLDEEAKKPCTWVPFGEATTEDNQDTEPNVTFIPGTTTEDSVVLVDGVLMQGVVKACLEYDSELPVPLLKITILGPNIGSH
jgi:hypothetical protein